MMRRTARYIHQTPERAPVPGPDLVRAGGHQTRLGIDRVAQLVAPLLEFLIFSQNPVHRRHRAVIDAFIQQRGIDFPRGLVGKPLIVECLAHGHFFVRAERPRRRWRGRTLFRDVRPAGGVAAAAGYAQRLAGQLHSHLVSQRFHHRPHFASGTSGIGRFSSTSNFFWASMTPAPTAGAV